jgi:hypothetical protein
MSGAFNCNLIDASAPTWCLTLVPGTWCNATASVCSLNGVDVPLDKSYCFFSTKVAPCSPCQNRKCQNGPSGPTLDGDNSYAFGSCGATLGSCTLDNVVVAKGQQHCFYQQSGGACGTCQNRTCGQGTGKFDGDDSYKYATCTPGTCFLDGVVAYPGDPISAYQSRTGSPTCTSIQRTCQASGQFDGDSNYQYASCTPGTAVTSCTIAGQIMWVGSDTNGKVEWCDGSRWYDSTVSTAGSCADTDKKKIVKVSGDLRYCDGHEKWKSMVGPTIGSTCPAGAKDSAAYFDAAHSQMGICLGGTWHQVGPTAHGSMGP